MHWDEDHDVVVSEFHTARIETRSKWALSSEDYVTFLQIDSSDHGARAEFAEQHGSPISGETDVLELIELTELVVDEEW